MQKIKALYARYREQIDYLVFGAMATLLNFVIFNVLLALFGDSFAAGAGNILNNALCILFAYWTNRTFVFRSRSTGAAARKEFAQFVGARLFTAVLDQAIMWLGVGVVGPALLSGGALPALTPGLWANAVKLFSQVVVIVSNYLFSKLFVFKA